MFIKLNADHSIKLLSMPESGMGYQCVEGTLLSDEKRKYIAFNAELLILFEELEEIKQYASYDELLSKGDFKRSEDIIETLEIESRLRFPKSSFSNKSRNPAQLPIQHTRDNEEFKRFSAYKNDRRITPGRSLHQGTYATTVKDISVVPSGLSAVSRYALPNPWPAIYVFTITPPEGTKIQNGTVQPAFNQSGGGVEIFFPNGTSDNTVSDPYIIPDR